MNVLHLRSSGGFFGAERVIVNLVNNSDKSAFVNHIAYFNNHKNLNAELVELVEGMGVKAMGIDCRFGFDFNAIRQLVLILKKNDIHILQTHGYKEDIIGYFAAKIAGVRKIAMVHGWTRHTLKVKIYELLDRFILRFFDKIIVVSDSLKKELIWTGISKNKIELIHNAIDVNKYSQNSNGEKIRVEFKIDDKETIIGTVGRLSKEKGHKYFLFSIVEILKKYAALKFIIVGNGPEMENLITLVKRLSIQDKVIFTGYRRDADSLFSAFDIFVLPSLREGLPNVLLEAYAHCKPVVATDVGEVGKLVKHKVTGFLVKPKDIKGLTKGLSFFLENPVLAKRTAENGYRLVRERFSLRDNIRKIEELYCRFCR